MKNPQLLTSKTYNGYYMLNLKKLYSAAEYVKYWEYIKIVNVKKYYI